MDYSRMRTCAAISATHPNDYQHPYGSSVGMILPVNEVKLLDVPELCYLASDVPNPRGEICVRGGSVTKGYYGLPEDTRAVLGKDGWLKTGDIGEMLPNGTLKVIDRKK
ncbi:AMP-dependent synthetase/ligase [Syncephalis fuscata]|nr:AMP-dependent synthetase/ligase [Syncephalis fuscata]